MSRNIIKLARGEKTNIEAKLINSGLGNYEIVFATDKKNIGVAYLDSDDTWKMSWFINKVELETILGGYLTEADISDLINEALGSVMTYKGSVADLAALNALTGMKNGDFYNVLDTGYNYAWYEAENEWDQVSGLTVYTSFAGASIEDDGEAGLVPAPQAGAQDYNKYLRGDGKWETPPNTTKLTMSPGTNTSGEEKLQLLSAESAGLTEMRYTQLVDGDNITFDINTAGEVTIAAADTTKFNWAKTPAASSAAKRSFLSKAATSLTDARYTELKAGSNITFTDTKIGELTIEATDTINFTKSPSTSTSDEDKIISFLNTESDGLNVVKYTKLVAGDNVTFDTEEAGELKLIATDSTYDVFTGASSSADGKAGLVIKPLKSEEDYKKYLRGDGKWETPPNTTELTMSEGTDTSGVKKLQLLSAESAGLNEMRYTQLVEGDNVTFDIGTKGKVTIAAADSTYDVFTGATANADGTAGLVKKPSKSDKDKYLRGDGTWADAKIFTKSQSTRTNGDDSIISFLNEESASIDAVKYTKLVAGDNVSFNTEEPGELKLIATDSTYDVFTGASSSADGKAGLVIKPLKSEEDYKKYLRGDGKWETPTDTKNTAGTSEENEKKLFLVGSEAQTPYEQTYTNKDVYIENKKLYSAGKVVFAAYGTKAAGEFYSGNTYPDASAESTRLNYDGNLYATKMYATKMFTPFGEVLDEGSVIDGGSLD